MSFADAYDERRTVTKLIGDQASLCWPEEYRKAEDTAHRGPTEVTSQEAPVQPATSWPRSRERANHLAFSFW
jgi:hypothetical protein